MSSPPAATPRCAITRTIHAGPSGFGLQLAERTGGALVAAVDRASDAHRQGMCAGLLVRQVEVSGTSLHLASSARLSDLVALLRLAQRATLVCVSATPDELALSAEAPLDARSFPVVTLRGLLSAEEIEDVHRVAAVWGVSGPRRVTRRAVRAAVEGRQSARDAHAASGASSGHDVCWLHAGGFFSSACPAICSRLVAAMLEHWPSPTPLGVRCIEYHRYTAGGGLLSPHHRDVGSALTMSLLLAKPAEGGHFVTRDAPGGRPVVHALDAGDAVVIRSEQIHNVTTVVSGERRSLVIELWEGGDNKSDRHF